MKKNCFMVGVRVFALGVLILLLSTPLIFAGGKSESDAAETKKVEVTFWQHSYPPLNDWTKRQIEGFMQKIPNITVNFELVPFEEYVQKIFTALATGQAPEIFEADDYTFATLMKQNALAAIDPLHFGMSSLSELQNQYEGNSLNLVTVNNKVYGIPYDWEAPVIGYNIALFNENGINPSSIKTWEDLGKAASKIAVRDANGVLTTAGFCFVHNIDVYYQLQGTTLFKQAGVEILNEAQTKSTINTPEAYKVFELWRDMIHKYKADDPGFTSSFYTEEFGKGRVGAGFMLTWANSILAPHNYLKGRDFDLLKIPTFKNGKDIVASYSWNWVINAKASDVEKEAATKFLAYKSMEGATYLQEAGLINPRKGWKDDVPEEELAKYKEIMDSLSNSEPVIGHTKYNEIWAPIINVFKSVELDANADIPSLVEECDKEINRILNE